MIEMAPIVATQNPQFEVAMEGRIGSQEALESIRHLLQLFVGEDAIEAAVETPYEVPGLDCFR